MKRPLRFWLVWSVVAVSLALIVVKWTSSLLAGQVVSLEIAQTWLLDVVPLVSAALGALIIVRHARHAIGWLLMIQGAGSALSAAAGYYLTRLAGPPANPGLLVLGCMWLTSWSWLLLIFPLLFIPLLFPSGRPLTPRWNWALALGVGMGLLLLTLATFSTFLSTQAVPWTVRNPIGFLPESWGRLILAPWSAGLVTLTLLGLASVVLRYRRGSPVERQQIKWLLVGCAVFAAAYAPSIWIATQTSENQLNSAWSLVFVLSLLAIPASIAIAILRQHLWDIDVIIRRTLTYSVLSLVLGLLYFGGVLLLQPVLGGLMGQGTALANVLSTLMIAALFVPLRARLQRSIDRRFFRQKYDAVHTLAGFAASARDETNLEQLAEDLVEVVQETMQPSSVGLWLRPNPRSLSRQERH